MNDYQPIRILDLKRDRDDGMIVTFSDGTSAGYVVDELLELRPHREPTQLGIGSQNGKQDD